VTVSPCGVRLKRGVKDKLNFNFPKSVAFARNNSTEILPDKEVIKVDIQSVQMKYEAQLMQLPNVTGVGIGRKAGKEAIVVFVTHKVPESALQPQEVVPKILEGYETDVKEIGVVTTQTQ
jgi:hypothetical protein